MIDIHDITNSIFTSKTYILSKLGEDKAWLVDIGDIEPVLSYIDERHLFVEGMFLTHAHFDHIYGINSVFDRFPRTKFYVANDYGRSVLYDPKKRNKIHA